MMALFAKADPDLKLQHDAESALRSKRRDRDSLAERLRTVAAAILLHRQTARELARDGADDAAISAAESRMRESADRSSTLSGAIVDVDKTIGELSAQIEQIVDKRVRAETSLAVDAMADRLSRAQVAHEAAALELELAAREPGLLIPEGVAVGEFTLSARQQLPAAIEMIMVGLRNHAKAVLNGGAKASLPRPAPEPPPRLAVVPPPMKTVFLLRHAKFQDVDGLHCLGKYRRHSLPQHLADRALQSGMAWPDGDKRSHGQEGAFGMVVPHPDRCEWLGDAPAAAPAPKSGAGPVIHHSAFEPHPSIPPPFNIKVARPPEPVPMAATWSAEDEP
jgi:hypothetical protein